MLHNPPSMHVQPWLGAVFLSCMLAPAHANVAALNLICMQYVLWMHTILISGLATCMTSDSQPRPTIIMLAACMLALIFSITSSQR